MSYTRIMDDEHLELLCRIASMYFEERFSQKKIARRTGYSQSAVSRMLTEAREQKRIFN